MTNAAALQTTADLSASLLAGAISQLVPTGTVFHYAGSTAPSGWLLCDGSAVSRTTYAGLFASISTTFGTGDGSTTFNVPDTRGIFVSGVGTQTISSISYSRTLGTKQGDLIQGHFHAFNAKNLSTGNGISPNNNANFPVVLNDGGTGVAMLYPSVNTSFGAGYGVQAPGTDYSNGTPRTGPETRPANIAMNYIIKI